MTTSFESVENGWLVRCSPFLLRPSPPSSGDVSCWAKQSQRKSSFCRNFNYKDYKVDMLMFPCFAPLWSLGVWYRLICLYIFDVDADWMVDAWWRFERTWNHFGLWLLCHRLTCTWNSWDNVLVLMKMILKGMSLHPLVIIAEDRWLLKVKCQSSFLFIW